MDMGILARILAQGGGPTPPGMLQGRLAQGFANAGGAHNRMLGRYGGTTPPNPTPRPGGILASVLQPQPTPQQQATQTRAPGMMGGFRNFIGNNSGALMGMGAGILSGGLAGGPQGAMQGFGYDQERRETERARQEQEAERARRDGAMMSLLTQNGMSRELAQTYLDAGMGEGALESVTRPMEGGDQFTLSPGQIRYDAMGNVVAMGGEDPDQGGSIPAELAGRLAAVDTVLPQLDEAEQVLTQDWSGWERATSALGSVTPLETEINRAQRTVRVAIEAALRMMTGAAAPESEVRQYMDMFMPQATDLQPARQQKMQNLRQFLLSARQYVLQGRADIPLPQSQPSQPSAGGDIGSQAQDAIRRGADPAAVAQRLRDAGYDPAQFGINAPAAQAVPREQMRDYWRNGGA